MENYQQARACRKFTQISQSGKESRRSEKESVETVVPCALGMVCNWDTVGDSAQSHEKGTKNTQAVAETNSNEFGRQGESSDSRNQVQRQP